MANEMVQIEVSVNEKLEVDVHVSDILYAVNRLPLLKKWNVIGNLISHLRLSKKDEDGDDIEKEDILNPEQVQIIKTFLEKQLDIITNYKP